MGCDIHLFVEVRETIRAPWRSALVKTPCDWCPKEPRERPCHFCKGIKLDTGYHDRNYDAFAILADVRNGRGFGGCDMGDGFEPISAPRGIPKDLSPELRGILEREEGDEPEDENAPGGYRYNRDHFGCGWFGDHSHSWLYLHELISYDWSRTTKHRGFVSASDFAAWDAQGGGRPKSYCGDVGGHSVRKISNEEMRALLASGYTVPTERPRESFYTQVEWTETYADSASRFHSVFLPELQKLGEQFGVSNVRIVFGFDS